LKKLE